MTNAKYFGYADSVYDIDKKTSYGHLDDDALCFGFYPVTLDGKYEFISEFKKTHYELAEIASRKLIGKALHYVDYSLIKTLAGQCYDRSYGTGRVWTNIKIIAFWYDKYNISVLTEVVNSLGINPEEYKIVLNEDDEVNVDNTLAEWMEWISEYGNKCDVENDTFRQFLLQGRDKWMIQKYNKSNTIWAKNKEKEGWDTIAQRNFMLRQENKDIKNKHMNTKKYKEEFSNYISIMKEALDRGNFDAYDTARDMLEESIGECRHEKELESQLDTNNFGVLNHIFEDRLPELFKSNKKAVRDVIKLIKEDKNLSAQFDFYNNIRNYKGKIAEMVDPVQFLSNFNAVVEKHKLIDKNTIIESNKKLRKVLKENNVIPTEFIDEEAMKLYNAGHNILTKKQSLKNMVTLTESINSVENYMSKHKDDKVNESVDPQQLISDFENKLKETLTESEMSFVKEITDWRSPIAEQRKEKLFNKFKNECISKVDEMLKEDSGNVELESLKKQLEEQKFNKDSIVQDIAKLLEIRDILLDK